MEIARLKKLEVFNADMCNIPFCDKTFDRVLSIASFHHLNSEERRLKALEEMYRILRPNGEICISVWSIKQPNITRRTFDTYGDIMVGWNNDETISRYYYIFKIDEIKSLFDKSNLCLKKHYWDNGNEIFILYKKLTS